MTALDLASQEAWTRLEEQAEQRMIVAMVVKAAERMPHGYIMSLLLAGYSEREIGRAIGKSHVSVYRYVHALRESIYSLLDCTA